METRYNGSASLEDVGNAIVVDNDGNVYICGYTGTVDLTHSDFLRDLVVVKYDTDGAFQWARTWHSTNLNPDAEAKDIAISADGNYVFVTGYHKNHNDLRTSDYLTIKLDARSSDGAIVDGWPKMFDDVGDNDAGVAIAVGDSEGNVWVTGRVTHTSGVGEWCTLKYAGGGTSGYGQELWKQYVVGAYNAKPAEPADIAVDIAGNCWGDRLRRKRHQRPNL